MNKVSGLIEGAPGSKFVFTGQGVELLDHRDDIAELATRFCSDPEGSETMLQGNEHVGVGNNSEVWGIGGVAMKLSTGLTGRFAYKYGTSFAPENLNGQLEFLDQLRAHLMDRSDGTISVPIQYFAVRNTNRDYLKAEQQMKGWISLHGFTGLCGFNWGELKCINQSVRARLIDGIADPILRRGLTDLGIYGREPLHDMNILVPEDTDDPTTAPLCIIDQPGKGIFARIIVKAARLQSLVS